MAEARFDTDAQARLTVPTVPTPDTVARAAADQKLYDTARHAVVPFRPSTPGQVRIYVCGATVDDAPHIGHMRAAVCFDVVRRWFLRLGYNVVFVRNVTDIDDKILRKAAAAHQQWWARAYHFERVFTDAYARLGVLAPTYEPRATGQMPEMIELVRRLIERGHAYVIPDENGNPSGNVFFDVPSWKDYGELTHQSGGHGGTAGEDEEGRIADQMGPSVDQSGEDKYNPADAADLSQAKHDPRDFALWKAAKPDEPATAVWQTPFGAGRPGWHLECTTMAHRYLGDEFDIHGGGLDLRFPHHENELAQARAAGWGFARHWMHSAWVTAKGEKMSKSLGNGLSAEKLLGDNPAWVVRYALASVHYRAMLEWGDDTLPAAQAAARRVERFVQAAGEFAGQPSRQEVAGVPADDLPADFTRAMNNDFDVSSALAVVFALIRETNQIHTAQNADRSARAKGATTPADGANTAQTGQNGRERIRRNLLFVRSMLDVFGLDPLASPFDGNISGQASAGADGPTAKALDALVTARLAARQKARKERDFATADAIRDELAGLGITVEDTASGSRWSFAG
jgi:cysteinyl-tRNA synthetase